MTAFNISNTTMSTILMQRSLADGVTSAPGGCLIGCWRRGANAIVEKHEEGLRRWLDEMAQDQCGQSEEGADSDGDFDADELDDEEEIDGEDDVSSDFDHGGHASDSEEKEEEEALECNRNKRPRTN
jgi:hypothetical protein